MFCNSKDVCTLLIAIQKNFLNSPSYQACQPTEGIFRFLVHLMYVMVRIAKILIKNCLIFVRKCDSITILVLKVLHIDNCFINVTEHNQISAIKTLITHLPRIYLIYRTIYHWFTLFIYNLSFNFDIFYRVTPKLIVIFCLKFNSMVSITIITAEKSRAEFCKFAVYLNLSNQL